MMDCSDGLHYVNHSSVARALGLEELVLRGVHAMSVILVSVARVW